MAELWTHASQEFIARKSIKALQKELQTAEDGFKKTIDDQESKVSKLACYPGSAAFKVVAADYFSTSPREAADHLFIDDLVDKKIMTGLWQSPAATQFLH